MYSFPITARKRSLGHGNVFTRVCHSVGFPACITGHMTWGGVRIHQGRADLSSPLRDTWDTTGYQC